MCISIHIICMFVLEKTIKRMRERMCVCLCESVHTHTRVGSLCCISGRVCVCSEEEGLVGTQAKNQI